MSSSGTSSRSRTSRIPLRSVCSAHSHLPTLAHRHAVEEILARTDRAVIKKLYNVEDFTSPLEFLTMVALTTGRLLKVRPRFLATMSLYYPASPSSHTSICFDC